MERRNKIFVLMLVTSFFLLTSISSATVTQSNIYPADNAGNIWIGHNLISVDIATNLGHVMNCTISLYQGATLIDTESKSGVENSTRTLNITSTLTPSTVYTIYVNANDVAVTGWTNQTYNFTTGTARLSENTNFDVGELLIIGLFSVILLLGIAYATVNDIQTGKKKITANYLIGRLVFYVVAVTILVVLLATI